ncbi:hypothetical protein HY792_04830 [Candidatus Desantisbacteria bacterium]|nr:hypothetical protein [Candidatus Desantisbacteria bacterium]
MYISNPLPEQKGMALALTLFFLLILIMGGTIFFISSQTEIKHSGSYERRLDALSLAESAAERAIWRLKTKDWSKYPNEWNNNFRGNTSLTPVKVATGQYMRVTLPERIFSGIDEEGKDYINYKIIASGIIGREQNGKVIPVCTKQIEVIVKVSNDIQNKTPQVFNYAYFLNNWGWWYYGGGEQCSGSMRSNGRFDVRGSGVITINGSIEAHNTVDYHNNLPNGLAGLRKKTPAPDYTTYPYKRSSLEKENIPNLQDMSYYEKIAEGYNPDTKTYDHSKGKINIGTKVFTDDGVFGDDEPHGNLILIGTKDAPIEIHDAVVVKGNLVMKGYVKTYGKSAAEPYASIYVGRNMYIAGDIQYINGPNWANYPQWQQSSGTDYKKRDNSLCNMAGNDDGLPDSKWTDTSSQKMDTWVGTNSTKSLLGVAAQGGLVYGNYSSNDWYSERWLFGMGNEDVGADGIPDTSDPGEGDNIFQKETEDLDGDGKFRNYDYNWKDITTTGGNSRQSAPLQDFEGLRKNGDSGQLWDPIEKIEINHYSQTATNMISAIDGVYYTQHFLAGRIANSPRIRGSLISKDEAIVYSGILQLIQDARCHSNYRSLEQQNSLIYLFPPGSVPKDTENEVIGTFQKVVSWREK